MLSGQELQTLLIEKVSKGEAKEVEALLTKGATVNNEAVVGKSTLLDLAVNRNNPTIVGLLLKQGVNYQDNIECIRTAARNGYDDCLMQFLEHASKINPITSYAFNTALLDMITRQQTRLVKKFIDAGVDVHKSYTNGETSLHLATINKDVDTIRLLMAARVDANRKDKKGITSRELALKSKDLAVIRLFPGLEREFELQNMQPTLVKAVKNDKLDQVRQLLEAGVNISTLTESVLHDAVYHNNAKMVALLLKHGANYQCLGKNKDTAMQYAYQRGNISCLEEFLKVPAVVKSAEMGMVLLDLVAAKKKRLIKEFVDAGVPTNLFYPDTLDNALHLAVLNREDDTIQLLLAHGANPHHKNKAGKTPIDLATEKSYWSAVTLFAEHAKSIDGLEKKSTPTSVKRLTDVELALIEMDYERIVRLFNKGQSVSRGLAILQPDQMYSLKKYQGKCSDDDAFQSYMTNHVKDCKKGVSTAFIALFDDIQSGCFSDYDLGRLGKVASFKERLFHYITSRNCQERFDILHKSVMNPDSPLYKIWHVKRHNKKFGSIINDILLHLQAMKKAGYQLSPAVVQTSTDTPVVPIVVPAPSAPPPPVLLYPEVIPGQPNVLVTTEAPLVLPEPALKPALVEEERRERVKESPVSTQPVLSNPSETVPSIEGDKNRLFVQKVKKRRVKKVAPEQPKAIVLEGIRH